MKLDSGEIQRYTVAERITHWVIAIIFVYLALTGLAFFTPHLFWLSQLLGGPVTTRIWHPILGIVYVLFLFRMYANWRRDMKIDAGDKEWARSMGKYIRNEDEGLP